MKSLVLKDIYNIGHNIKSVLFIYVIFAFVFIPSAQVSGYIFMCTFLCAMMIITTFTFDEKSGWAQYALITPVSRRDIVTGKYIVLLLFCAVGSLSGLLVGLVAGGIIHMAVIGLAEIGEMAFYALVAWGFAVICGGVSIPLVFRFGSENGRLLIAVSFLLPGTVCYGVYRLLALFKIEMTERLVLGILCCAPFIGLLWCYGMYRISCRIFAKKEL